MWFTLMILVFVFTIGVTIGGLLAAPKEPVRVLQVFLFSFFFSVISYLGMIAGMFLTGFVPLFLIEVILCILALLFIVASMTRFHSTFGFFHPEDRLLLPLLAILFFIMGFEWGSFDYRTFFTISATFLFTSALLIGLFIQMQIRNALWRQPYVAYAPLVWLLFVTVLKLI